MTGVNEVSRNPYAFIGLTLSNKALHLDLPDLSTELKRAVSLDRFLRRKFHILRLLNFPHTCYRSAMKTATLEMWKKEHSFAFHGLPCSKTYCIYLFHLRCCHQTAPYVSLWIVGREQWCSLRVMHVQVDEILVHPASYRRPWWH